MESKIGVLLINLGTPDEPTPEKVAIYLREFLMDEHVVDIPRVLRWILVHLLIVPRRSHASAEAYRKIWTERGSPLKFHSVDLTEKVGAAMGSKYDVRLAMRYQNPSVETVLMDWKKDGIEEIRMLPLYPQYARASSFSSEETVLKALKKLGFSPRLKILPAFYDDPGFIDTFVERARTTPRWKEMEHVLFSFHGLPERQILRAARGDHCLRSAGCCDSIVPANSETCYRAHCYQTARKLSGRLELTEDNWSVSFQSRLGRTKWIEPYTDEVIPKLASRGIKRIAVMCPAFVADCLETLEEIGIRAQEQFRALGGEEIVLIPSLNSEPRWVETVARLAKEGAFR